MSGDQKITTKNVVEMILANVNNWKVICEHIKR